jgi:hypothetical protein
MTRRLSCDYPDVAVQVEQTVLPFGEAGAQPFGFASVLELRVPNRGHSK